MLKQINDSFLRKQHASLVRAAWEKGYLRYKYHSGQRRLQAVVDNSKQKLKTINVTRQFGKTFWEACFSTERAIQQKRYIKIATAYLKDLEEFVLPAFEEVLHDCPRHLIPKYNYQKSKFVFPDNKSQIKLIGLDRNPDGLRGNVTDDLFLDETGYIRNVDYLYKSVILPSTTHRPKANIIFISTPPESLDHPFIHYAHECEKADSYFHATIYDNPLLSKEQVNEIIATYGGVDSIEFRREYMAEFIVDSTKAVIPEWNDKYVGEIESNQFTPFYHRYTAMDIGVRDFTAILFGQYVFDKSILYIEDETELSEFDVRTDLIARIVKQKESELFGGVKPRLRIADNNNLILLQDLASDHKLSFSPTNKDKLHAMINELRIFIQSGRLVVHPRCKMLIANLRNALWNDKRDDFKKSKTYKHFDHLAALVYLVRNLDQHTNPIPQTFAMTASTHFISKDLKQDKNVAEFKKIFNIRK